MYKNKVIRWRSFRPAQARCIFNDACLQLTKESALHLTSSKSLRYELELDDVEVAG